MNAQNLETQYLKAKVAYYEGNPIMSDSAFDVLEKELKSIGSKVVEQVGSKRKDFDFPHPSLMLSLAKIQTEDVNGITNYQEDAFYKWFNKINTKIFKETGNHIDCLLYSPKFDGNAINIVYEKGIVQTILTRGDGKTGKDVTDRLEKYVPAHLNIDDTATIIELRCECVINQNVFNENYFGTKEEGKYANARNFVAGVLGKDDFSLEKVADLTLIPVILLIDGKQAGLDKLPKNVFGETCEKIMILDDYINCIKSMEVLRKTFQYPLDGVVISTEAKYRDILGYNEHDPEFSIAIKFVSDEVVTRVVGVEWNISKTGEYNPVVLLYPVELAGTIVKRASGYNAGYIVNNKIGEDSFVSILKAGEIIPEIQVVTVESLECFPLPTHCIHCGSTLEFDGIHLICPNDDCVGKIAKKLASGASVLDLKNVGGKTLEPFAKEFKNMYELMRWILQKDKDNAEFSLEMFGIKPNSRSHEIFVNAFKNIKSLTYVQVIIILGYDNVGKKISIQLAKEHCGITPDYKGLEKALVNMLHDRYVEAYIKTAVKTLEELGIIIDKPKKEIINNLKKEKEMETNTIFVCMTGSPKVLGFATKAEFIKCFPNLVDVEITDKKCQLLLTDSYNSTSSKMKTAEKKGIPVKTYGDYGK